jgi:hypothetical protein
MRKRLPIREEKVAKKIAELLSPVDLDLDGVGFYVANLPNTVHYNRLILIAESAVSEQERINDKTGRPLHTLF